MAVSSIQISLIPSKSDSPYLERKNCIVRKHRLVIELLYKRKEVSYYLLVSKCDSITVSLLHTFVVLEE